MYQDDLWNSSADFNIYGVMHTSAWRVGLEYSISALQQIVLYYYNNRATTVAVQQYRHHLAAETG